MNGGALDFPSRGIVNQRARVLSETVRMQIDQAAVTACQVTEETRSQHPAMNGLGPVSAHTEKIQDEAVDR